MGAGSYVVLLPVKPPGVGKTRLEGLPREPLARAFALDTATAALASSAVARVLSLTDDAGFASALADLGCAAIPDGVSGDLNASLVLAAMEAARRWPDLTPVAICADLPCLRPADLDAALAERDGWPRFVRRRVRDRDDALHRAAGRVRAALRPAVGGAARGRRRLAGAGRPRRRCGTTSTTGPTSRRPSGSASVRHSAAAVAALVPELLEMP